MDGLGKLKLGSFLFRLLRFKLLHLLLIVLAELVALQEGLDGVGAGGVLIRAQLELFDLGGFVEKTFVAA